MKSVKKNWRTTLLGILTAAPFIVEGIMSKDFSKIIEGIGMCVLGGAAKDGAVTGL